ncbi:MULTISPECIES: hypothetical protein [unclassified Mycobacterium]|uniref:hypothetical protein n=1 Tax=unclassified Mycobacterium TaxID=2642494 RepID=UPI0029C90D13|nr:MULTISPECIES: hypothetical protein [unclassified Mycobacterium]
MIRTVDPIAPGAAAFAEAGGVLLTGASSAKCEMCGEWNDGPETDLKQWARWHARDRHDALRPSVLGLDTSLTRAGIAVCSLDPKRETFWPTLLTHVGESGSQEATWDERCDRLVRQTKAIIGIVDAARRAGADIRVAAVEGPSYGNSAMPSYYDRAGLSWAVYAALRARGIPIAVVTPDHRAKFICGVKPPSGPAGKKLVLDQTRARWNTTRTLDVIPDPARFIANHDEADALGLAEMGVMGVTWTQSMLLSAHPVPWRVGSRHVGNAVLVKWPAVTI